MNHFAFCLTCLLCTFALSPAVGQSGCTDPCANNYDINATLDDGSCAYTINNVTTLPAGMAEVSGLAYAGSDLWAHNDGGNANEIYRIDPSNGNILQTVTILNGTNTSTGSPTTTEDWEDIAVSPTHIYIGDFGNNNGNRENLKVYRILRSAVAAGTNVSLTADVIAFTYSDQGTPPFASNPNNNDFDCEAMIWQGGTLHLFSKNWVDNQTRHYLLPDIAGTQVATYQSTYASNGIITGADIAPSGAISLIGNTTNFLNPEVIMIYLGGYSGNAVFSGNIRHMTLGSSLVYGQVEGIAFSSDTQAIFSTEAVNVAFPPINITQQIYEVGLCPGSILALGDVRGEPIKSLQAVTEGSTHIYPNPVSGPWTVVVPAPATLTLIDLTGRPVFSQTLISGQNPMPTLDFLPHSTYQCLIIDNTGEGVVEKLLISPR